MPQSYYLTKNHQNNEILVASFNSFVGDINNIVGIGVDSAGYGQGHLVVATASEQVTTPGWDALLTAMKFAGRHQGTILYSPTSTSDASWPTEDILSIIPTITTDIANIVGNRLNSDVAYMTATPNVKSSNNTYVDPAGSPGTPFWTSANQIYYEAKVQFADANARRHFFNAGGEVRFDSVLSSIDASHSQSADWKTMLSDISVVKLRHSITEASTGVGTEGVGFSSLTPTYQVIYTKGGTGDYSGNQLNIHAKLSGTADIDIKIAFDDKHVSNITAGNFEVGIEYTIVQVGTTDFTTIGASDNNKAGTVVAHTALVIGDEYTITSNDDASNPVDWVALGAVDNGGGAYPTRFTATATGNPETLSSSLVTGKDYTIKVVGSTDFTTLGSANNTVGTTFTATGQTETVFRSGTFVIGKSYKITVVGTLDFTTIGAPDNNLNTVFTATGTGPADGSTGEGTLQNIGTADYVATGTATTTATRFTATGPGTGTGVASYTTGTWTNSPYSGTWTGMDYVAGILTVTFDELIATDTPDGVKLSSPTYSHLYQL
jgi:hypothetical protein|tara:strand:- start:483 stop:2126 length:1644 start_codon:yes stop_codon:yes gene_type:complete